MTTPLLAHAGAGATWQALVATLCVGIAVVFLLAVVGRLRVTTPGDLIAPLAVVAIAASVAPGFSDTLSDTVGYALPVGAFALGGLLVVALSSLEADWLLGAGVAAAAALTALLAGPALTDALHPPPQFLTLPDAGGARITIVRPDDGDQLPVDQPVEVVVAVEQATIGPPQVDTAPANPQQLTHVVLFVGADAVTQRPDEACTVDRPCRELSYELDLPAGTHTLVAELRAWNGDPFLSPVTASVTVTVGGARTS